MGSAFIPSSNTPFTSNVTVTTTSGAALLNQGTARYRMFFNNSTTIWLWLGFGVPAVVGLGIPLFPRGTYEMSFATQNMYTGEVFAISESSTALLTMMEHRPNT